MIRRGQTAASEGGHGSIGMTYPAASWYLPESSSKRGFETWLCIQNPNPREATCELTYMIEDKGPQDPIRLPVPPFIGLRARQG